VLLIYFCNVQDQYLSYYHVFETLSKVIDTISKYQSGGTICTFELKTDEGKHLF
jgi:hypothetical protein